MVQRVLLESTDTLLAYPSREHLGVPSGATMRVQTPSVALPDSADAATVDPVSDTTTAEAAAGTDVLAFASDPGATRGRLYLLEDPQGVRLTVEVVSSGASTVIAEPLPFTVASGATLSGIAITHALTAAETVDKGDGFAEVVATIDGVSRRWIHSFEVVRRVIAVPLTSAELLRDWPQVRRLRADTDETLGEAIQSAWDNSVLFDLEGRGFETDRIMSPSRLRAPLGLAVVKRLTEAAHPADVDRLEDVRNQYRFAIDTAVNGADFWYNAAADEAPGQPSRGVPLIQQVVRYSR